MFFSFEKNALCTVQPTFLWVYLLETREVWEVAIDRVERSEAVLEKGCIPPADEMGKSSPGSVTTGCLINSGEVMLSCLRIKLD